MKRGFVLQPGYVPWLGFWEMMLRCDVFVVLDDVQYTRRDWRNRNRIKTPAGAHWLTIPVESRGRFTQRILDTAVDHSTAWRESHLKTVAQFYRKAPFFDEIYPRFETALTPIHPLLVDYLLPCLEFVRDYLESPCEMIRASALAIEADTRQDRIIELCRAAGIDWYYNGAAGRSIYQEADFRAAGIELVFQDYHHPTYPQLWGDFVPYLSVLDLLFNCGPKSAGVVLGRT